MKYDAFQQVSTALQERIQAALGSQTVHVGPLDDDDAASADLVLFLYRVAINADLRNLGHVVPPATPQDPTTIHENALPFDLFYLLTASPAKTGTDLEGLGKLGRAIQALNDEPFFVGPPLGGELVRVSIDSVTTDEMSRVWTLFPTANFRTSVIYLVTPVWIDPAAPLQPATPVVSESYGAAPIPA